MTSDLPPIAVLLGGPSAEHDVSVVSGSAIADALEDLGHTIERILIDLDGRWWRLPAGTRGPAEPASAWDDPVAIGATGPEGAATAVERMAGSTPTPVVFIALHGPFGEDGTVQALLEAAGLAYTGSAVAASALGMDKALFKRLCRGIGLPVGDWLEIRAERWAADRSGVLLELEAFAAGTGDPRLMIKPARLGSSVGMTLAHTPDERSAAIELALSHCRLVLAEAYLVDARDLEVAILGNDPARLELYGPGEIVASNEFYDFAAKYTPGLSRSTPTADVDPVTRATILKIARDCYRAIGAEGFARVDYLLNPAGVFLSEINTIPGFTPISLFPAMAALGGYTFGGVAERIVELALERQRAAIPPHLTPTDLPR